MKVKTYCEDQTLELGREDGLFEAPICLLDSRQADGSVAFINKYPVINTVICEAPKVAADTVDYPERNSAIYDSVLLYFAMDEGTQWAELCGRLSKGEEQALLDIDRLIGMLIRRLNGGIYGGFSIPHQDFNTVVSIIRVAAYMYAKVNVLGERGAFGALVSRICSDNLRKYATSKGIKPIARSEKSNGHHFPLVTLPSYIKAQLEETELRENIYGMRMKLYLELGFYLDEFLAIRHGYGYSPFKKLSSAAEAFGMTIEEFWRKARVAHEILLEMLEMNLR